MFVLELYRGEVNVYYVDIYMLCIYVYVSYMLIRDCDCQQICWSLNKGIIHVIPCFYITYTYTGFYFSVICTEHFSSCDNNSDFIIKYIYIALFASIIFFVTFLVV